MDIPQVEVDATSVRTTRIAPNSHAFAAEIAQWRAAHPGQGKPQHFARARPRRRAAGQQPLGPSTSSAQTGS